MANRMIPDYEERLPVRPTMLEDISIRTEGLAEEGDHCVVLCKKLTRNVFFIKSGLLIIDENKGLSSPEALSVTCLTKIVFIPA